MILLYRGFGLTLRRMQGIAPSGRCLPAGPAWWPQDHILPVPASSQSLLSREARLCCLDGWPSKWPGSFKPTIPKDQNPCISSTWIISILKPVRERGETRRWFSPATRSLDPTRVTEGRARSRFTPHLSCVGLSWTER